jgi:predicted  nucleic acid-binding Zn-ribbon protein
VRHDACPACHERLPRARLTRMQSHTDLDVCDHCGVFLVLPPAARTDSAP